MEVAAVNKKLISGFLTLSFRKAILLAISFVTINLVLARILPVSVIGIFNIANSILAFFSYFSDIGLAGALIQKKEITIHDLKTTFTIQESLAFLLTVILIIFAPNLAGFYGLDQSGIWLIRALAIGFFLTSLKVIPSVLLERELNFGRLVWVEISETLLFNGALIFFVWQNYQIDSFSYSVLIRSVAGSALINYLSPWKISLGVNKTALKSLLSFGLPFQTNSILALLKDRLVPLVVARIVGASGVGLITWAQSVSFMSLEVMNIMSRITFPAFSRLQHDEKALKNTLEKTLFLTSILFYPMLFGFVAIAPKLISEIVSAKWQPALPLIYLFSVTVFWANLSSPFTNFLNAIGRVKTTLKLMVMWTVLEWVLTPIATIKFGFLGVGIASAVISFSSVIPIIIIKKIIPVAILTSIWQALLSAGIMFVFASAWSNYFVHDYISLIVSVLLSAVLYSGLIYILAGDKIKSALTFK